MPWLNYFTVFRGPDGRRFGQDPWRPENRGGMTARSKTKATSASHEMALGLSESRSHTFDIGVALPYPFSMTRSNGLCNHDLSRDPHRDLSTALFHVMVFVWSFLWLVSPGMASEPPVTTPPGVRDYPHVIVPLPPDQLAGLRTQFARDNPTICVDLNRYGFTTARPSCPENRSRVDIEDEDAAIDAIGAWLTAHAHFTGFTARTHVELKTLTEIHGCAACTPPDHDNSITELQLYFPGQFMFDLPVEGDVNPLVVIANANGVIRVESYWLPETPLPLRTTIRSSNARQMLLGRPVPPGDGNGTTGPHLITDHDLRHAARRVVFVNESPRGLEVRVAWKIPVGGAMLWTAYVDAITGEVLRIIPTPKQEGE